MDKPYQVQLLNPYELAKKIEDEAQCCLEEGELALVDSAHKYTEAMSGCEGIPLGLQFPEAVRARAACDVFVEEFDAYRKRHTRRI